MLGKEDPYVAFAVPGEGKPYFDDVAGVMTYWTNISAQDAENIRNNGMSSVDSATSERTPCLAIQEFGRRDGNPGSGIFAKWRDLSLNRIEMAGGKEMNDKEYGEFLEAVGKRYLRLHRASRWFHPEGIGHLHYDIERLASTARLVHAVEERSNETAWYGPLSKELKNTYIQNVTNLLDAAGIIDALDEHGELIFSNLSRELIPDEDIALLHRAGVEEPEAEVTIVIQELRQSARSRDIRASSVLREASKKLEEAAKQLSPVESNSDDEKAEVKPRKYFTGIGRILSGGIVGAGNLLLGIGTIPASGGATAGAVIASSALAVGLVSQGIGDLRGE
jgi:hypothetical protein